MPPYTSSQAAMSNFTRLLLLVPSLLLKGLCSNFNADIYSRRRNILYIVCLQSSAGGVCFIFARREYPLHTSSHSYPFITRPACAARPGTVVYSAPASTRPRERERVSVEIGGDGNSSMQCVSEFASENARRCWCSTFVRRKSPEKVHLHNFHINSGPVYSWHLWLI
jgi:hypothetical protein